MAVLLAILAGLAAWNVAISGVPCSRITAAGVVWLPIFALWEVKRVRERGEVKSADVLLGFACFAVYLVWTVSSDLRTLAFPE